MHGELPSESPWTNLPEEKSKKKATSNGHVDVEHQFGIFQTWVMCILL